MYFVPPFRHPFVISTKQQFSALLHSLREQLTAIRSGIITLQTAYEDRKADLERAEHIRALRKRQLNAPENVLPPDADNSSIAENTEMPILYIVLFILVAILVGNLLSKITSK